MDEVDQKIIRVLRRDARTPFTTIGKELGISDATIHFRVKKMRKAGIIRKYTVVVNENVYESRVSCYMLIKAKHGKINDISRKLVGIERVNLVHEVHGSNDIVIKVGATDLEGLRNAVMKIQENPDIVTSEYLTILKTWKE